MAVSTIDRTRRPASPHTAVLRRRATLLRRGRRLLAATEELLTPDEPSAFDDAADLNVLVAQLDVVTADVTERLGAPRENEHEPTTPELGRALVDLHTFRAEVHYHEVHERLDRLDALEAGIAPLRWIHDPDELLGKVCET